MADPSVRSATPGTLVETGAGIGAARIDGDPVRFASDLTGHDEIYPALISDGTTVEVTTSEAHTYVNQLRGDKVAYVVPAGSCPGLSVSRFRLGCVSSVLDCTSSTPED